MANGTDGGAASGPLTLNRRPLTLKNDPETKSPYAAGLSEIRVRNAAQARELASRGAENRAVFGTLANRSSSRSHGIFTVKIIREHAGATGDMSICATTSRLAIVDLAGSERINNTGASGQRAKEAGSINKSLMVLGQCMEELRKSQARATSAIPALARPGAPMEPRLVTPSQSVTSFRHSKLTALIHSYFTCEGRAVMIVNVNPYDTGFDENKNVFRFSAVAKKVNTMRPQANAPVRSLPRPKTAGLAGASSHNDHDVEDTKRESLAGDVTIIEGTYAAPRKSEIAETSDMR